MKSRIVLAFLFALASPASVNAQTAWPSPSGAGAASGSVAMCLNGSSQAVPCSVGTPLQIAGSFSATLGGFTPAGTFAAITATATSASVALPAGAVVIFQNTGTTAVSCTLGIGSATAVASQNIVQAGSWLALTVGSNTFGACIDQSGSASNVVALSGGAGLPTGSGGGGGGGSGGSVTQGTVPWVVSNAGTFAVQATLGATQNTNLANIDSQTSRLTSSTTNVVAGSALATTSFVVGSRYLSTPPTFTNGQEGALQIDANGKLLVTAALPTGASTAANQATEISSLATIATNTGAAIPAGTALIGKVGVDQTTPGTTNGVAIVGVNAATALAGNGATGTGSQRITVASDNTLPAGWASSVGIASTTSGQTGPLAQGAVTTAAPTYTTAQTNPLSLTTAGALRQDVSSIAGTATATGSGVMGAGTQRMALATDSPGIVTLGQAAKASSVPVAIASDQVGTAGTANATVTTVQGIASMTPIIANSTNGYPSGAIAETVSATGTTAATTATLATAVGKTTYICGFAIRANATAAATGTATVTGVITATMSFVQWTAPLASGIGTIEQRFSPCVPASATNTGVAVVSAAPGSGGTVSVAAWGYQL